MGHEEKIRRFMGTLSVFATVPAVVAILGGAANSASAQITNNISAIPIEADGAYTGFAGGDAQWTGEWSDITPAWFISNDTTGATPVPAGTPGANSLLFAGLSRDTPTSAPELYLMYDYLGFTVGPTGPNQFLGSVSFPLTIGGVSEKSTVTFTTVPSFTGFGGSFNSSNFFDATVSLGGGAPIPASTIGLEAGDFVGVTPVDSLWGVTATSPFHTTPHELMELGVPLDISTQFALSGGPTSPFPQGGEDGDGKGNGYSPAPAFWSSDLVDDAGDPPASGGLFTIHPDGSTLITPATIGVPEPTSLGLLAFGGVLLGVRRRKASR